MPAGRPHGLSCIMPKAFIALPQNKCFENDNHHIHPSSACSGITWHQRLMLLLHICTTMNKSEKNHRKLVYERKIM